MQSSSSEESEKSRKTFTKARKNKKAVKKKSNLISSSSSSDGNDDTFDEINAFIQTGECNFNEKSNLRRSKRHVTKQKLDERGPSSPPASDDNDFDSNQDKTSSEVNDFEANPPSSSFLEPQLPPPSSQALQRPSRSSIPLNAPKPMDRKSFPRDTPIQPNQDPMRTLPSRIRNREKQPVQLSENSSRLSGDQVLSPFQTLQTPALQKQNVQQTVIASPRVATLHEEERDIIRLAADDLERETSLNLSDIKAICNRKLNNRLASERFAKTAAGYYKSYVITEKVSEEEVHLYHFDDHEVEKYQRGFVVVLKKIRQYRGDGSRFTIFRKFLYGEEWDDMSPEELKRARLFDFDLEDFDDIPDSGTVLKRYQLPIRDSNGVYKTNWLSIDENGRIVKNPIIEKGFGHGQSTVDFTGVAMVLNKTNVSANVGNQIVSSTGCIFLIVVRNSTYIF